MSTIDEEEYRHKQDLLLIKQRAKRQLERQAAAHGIDVPQAIAMGLEQAITDIAALKEWLTAHTDTPSLDVREALGDEQLAITVVTKLKGVEKTYADALTELKHWTTDAIGQLTEQVSASRELMTRIDAASQEWRRNERDFRVERQRELDDRLTVMEQQVNTNTEGVQQVRETMNWVIVRVVVIVAIAMALAIASGWWLAGHIP